VQTYVDVDKVVTFIDIQVLWKYPCRNVSFVEFLPFSLLKIFKYSLSVFRNVNTCQCLVQNG